MKKIEEKKNILLDSAVTYGIAVEYKLIGYEI